MTVPSGPKSPHLHRLLWKDITCTLRNGLPFTSDPTDSIILFWVRSVRGVAQLVESALLGRMGFHSLRHFPVKQTGGDAVRGAQSLAICTRDFGHRSLMLLKQFQANRVSLCDVSCIVDMQVVAAVVSG